MNGWGLVPLTASAERRHGVYGVWRWCAGLPCQMQALVAHACLAWPGYQMGLEGSSNSQVRSQAVVLRIASAGGLE